MMLLGSKCCKNRTHQDRSPGLHDSRNWRYDGVSGLREAAWSRPGYTYGMHLSVYLIQFNDPSPNINIINAHDPSSFFVCSLLTASSHTTFPAFSAAACIDRSPHALRGTGQVLQKHWGTPCFFCLGRERCECRLI